MANDVSSDSNCKAWWKYESGAITADSKGTNTLTDNGTVGSDTSDYKEGSGCATFNNSVPEYLSITDSNLDSGFPLKNGDTTKIISWCGWRKFSSLVSSAYIFCKGEHGTSTRSFALQIESGFSYALSVDIGISGGSSFEKVYFGTGFSTDVWYFIAVTFDDSDGSYRIRIWDDTAGALLDTDATGNFTNSINVEDGDLQISSRDGGSYAVDGKADSDFVFNRVLSVSEIDDLRNGVFGAGVSPINLSASLTNASSTTDIDMAMVRDLSAALTNQSLTTDIAIALSGVINLVASITNQSSTSDIDKVIARDLMANLSNASSTSDISVTLGSLINFACSLTNQSGTTGIDIVTTRDLVAAISNTSSTSALDILKTLNLSATIGNSSLTSDIEKIVERNLGVNLSNQSITPDDVIIILGALAIAASDILSIEITQDLLEVIVSQDLTEIKIN